MKFLKIFAVCMGLGLVLASCGDDSIEDIAGGDDSHTETGGGTGDGGSNTQDDKDVPNDLRQASVTGKVYDISAHTCMVEA